MVKDLKKFDQQQWLAGLVSRVKSAPGQILRVPPLKKGGMSLEKFRNILGLKAGIVVTESEKGLILAIPKKTT